MQSRNTFSISRLDGILLLVTLGVVLFGALPRFSWNDGSRLATAECLVDYHTWQIDQSFFQPHTGDKVFINGHFYSDKPPVLELAMAVVYKVLQGTMGLKAAQQPNLYCYLMALIFGGSAFIISVFCLNRLAVRSGLPDKIRLPLVASFAFGMIALTYSRAVNNHILMLAVVAGLFLQLVKSAEPGWEKFSKVQLCAIGTLLGLGYSLDLGGGPVLVICTTIFLIYRTRSFRNTVIVLAVSFPWFALHHALNYMIGGTFLPYEGVVQYFQYPGSAFNAAQDLTGASWAHPGVGDFLVYSLGLLFGNQGFIVHNLVLLLAIPAAVMALRDTIEKRVLVYFSLGLILGVWLLYAATSGNYSGQCVSIRWFVPLLIPFYYVLILALQRQPALLVDLLILAGWSIVLGVLLWLRTPWTTPMVPALWYINLAALLSWLVYRGCQIWAMPGSPLKLAIGDDEPPAAAALMSATKQTKGGLQMQSLGAVGPNLSIASRPAVASLSPTNPKEPKTVVNPWLGWVLLVAEWGSLAGIFLFMLTRSWLKWMDPLIDFPRDLYLAWRVSEGDLLYEKVANWYGPLPQLAEGAGFHLFGVGIDTIVWMNIALTIGVVVLIWDIFGALGNSFSRWLCLVVFIVVFAFGHYTSTANYNFIAPYVAQSTYGFAGLVLLLWALLHQLKSVRPYWSGVAGLGLAVTYLDKPEPLLAAVGALAVYCVAGFLRQARKNPEGVNLRGALRRAAQSVGWLAGGFLSLWLPVFLYFFFRGGFVYALLAADYVPHTLLDARFQDTIEHSHLAQTFIGFDDPWPHFFSHGQAGAGLITILGVLVAASHWWMRAKPLSPAWCVAPCIMLLAVGVAIGVEIHENHWMNLGEAMVFPVMLAAVVAAGWSWWAAWRNRGDAAHWQGLAMVGAAAALMLARMILHGRIYQFGFFMMPLAVLFVVHLVVSEAARPQPARPRAHWLLPAMFSFLVLWGVISLGSISLRVYASKTASVGEGRDRFYTFPARASSSGPLLNLMIHVFRIKTPNAKSLVVFPEGIAANYHLRVPSPLAELEFHPVALGYMGPDEVVDELKDHPPEAIFLTYRSYTEFGEKYFASDAASGRPIMVWVAANYVRVAKGGRTDRTVTGNMIDLLIPKPPPAMKPLDIVEPIM